MIYLAEVAWPNSGMQGHRINNKKRFDASGTLYRNPRMIKEVSKMLANIRTAVHDFAIETPLWTEELCHAEHGMAEGVEMVAGSLSNIVRNARTHICLAISADVVGFIEDLDNFQGPGRIDQGGSDDERKRKRETSIEREKHNSRRPRSSTDQPPDSATYDPAPHLGDSRSIVQRQVEAEQRRSIEESMHPSDIQDF